MIEIAMDAEISNGQMQVVVAISAGFKIRLLMSKKVMTQRTYHNMDSERYKLFFAKWTLAIFLLRCKFILLLP